MHKEKIIVDKKTVTTSNTYKCDMTKPYEFADAPNSQHWTPVMAFMGIIIIGLIILLLCTSPTIKESPAKLIPIILFPCFYLSLGAMFAFYHRKNINKKKELENLLVNAVIILGVVKAVKKESVRGGTNRLTICLENGDVKDIISSTHIFLNQKIAIAKSNNKEFILTRCTLI